jgi:hypothetical protein
MLGQVSGVSMLYRIDWWFMIVEVSLDSATAPPKRPSKIKHQQSTIVNLLV